MIRCMGGAHCNHAPGTCTATKGDTQTPPDWVLTRAARRGGFMGDVSDLQHSYEGVKVFRALCDMILKHEQPPVDRKLLCANEVHRMWCADEIMELRSFAVRAIELWEEGFGKCPTK